VVGDSAGPCEACAPARDRIHALGVGQDGARAPRVRQDGVRAIGIERGGALPLEGLGETEPAPPGESPSLVLDN
jgi:hypothetical protein